MKITIANIEDFKPYMGKSRGADAGYEFIVENGDLYDDDDTIKESIDKALLLINKVVSENSGDANKTKPSSNTQKPKEKKDKTKKEKADKKKDNKPEKTKVGEATAWQRTLRRFASMCGRERTVTSIRTFVKEIQATFDAKRNGNTPHIDLIREIQTKLLPKANNASDRKVTLPAWEDLKKKCQEAAREVVVSKSVKRPDLTEQSLAGHNRPKKKARN